MGAMVKLADYFSVLDHGKLIASGRGTYLTASPKTP